MATSSRTGSCGVLIAEKTRCQPAHRQRAPENTVAGGAGERQSASSSGHSTNATKARIAKLESGHSGEDLRFLERDGFKLRRPLGRGLSSPLPLAGEVGRESAGVGALSTRRFRLAETPHPSPPPQAGGGSAAPSWMQLNLSHHALRLRHRVREHDFDSACPSGPPVLDVELGHGWLRPAPWSATN